MFHLSTQRVSVVSGTGEAVAVTSHAGATKAREADAPPTVAVLPFKVISGDEEVASLVQGLHEDILGGLARMTAITVLGGDGGDGGADFRLEGSVRAVGRRLRLSFTLFDAATQSQAWSERYDRQLDDVFDLEDEISENVVTAVRIRLKARAFEKLRGTENAVLSMPDLLSKTAGYFVNSYGHNQEVAEILRLVMDRKPDMAYPVVPGFAGIG